MKVNVTLGGGECPRTIHLSGRLGWTLYQLAETGERGLTPLEKPALRLASYVHQLRQKGILIDTEIEEHGGAYKGRHARYRLACEATVTVLASEGGQ